MGNLHIRRFVPQLIRRFFQKNLTDLDLRTDLSWVKRITNRPENTVEVLTDILKTNTIPYDEEYLISKFTNPSSLIKITIQSHYFTLECSPERMNSSLNCPTSL